jgi:hypothetical protein
MGTPKARLSVGFGKPIAKRSTGRLPRLAVTLFALLAFALQSYVTQTHIHKPAGPGFAAIAAALTIGAPIKDRKAPAKQDQNCPLCQAVAHSGAFVSPSAAPTLLPTLSVQIIVIVADVALAFEALSHDWLSRGPPRA